MKKIVLLGFVLLFLCAANLLKLQTVHASPYTNIDVNTAYNMITNGSYPNLAVLDVRTQSEYDDGHVYGAVWIPHTELETRIDELAGHENHEIIAYCKSGFRSANASNTLDSHNFTKVYNMLGGILAWENASYPVWNATVHNINTTFNYDTIQAAIDAPQTLDGHTIRVGAETYYENVVVSKSLSLVGENKHNTLIDASGSGHVVRVTANDTEITGFTIRKSGCGCAAKSGIYVENYHQNVNVTNNLIIQNGYGIRLSQNHNITMASNNITNNAYDAISLSSSSNNTIFGNNIKNNSNGIVLYLSSFNTVSGNNIKKSNYGIWLYQYSSNNTFSRNNITDNGTGIYLQSSNNNTFSANSITNNGMGIWLLASSNSGFYSNNFASNTQQVYIGMSGYANLWDNGVEGNYWSNYTGVDSNHDGIGDSTHVLDGDNTDNYPAMGRFSSFGTSSGYHVNLISNSTIEDFAFFEANSTIMMYVSNMTANQTFGFCRVTIPKSLVSPPYTIVINDGLTDVLYFNDAIYDNDTHRWVYFAYEHSTHKIEIIPEFPSFLILPLFMIATLLAVIIYKRKHST